MTCVRGPLGSNSGLATWCAPMPAGLALSSSCLGLLRERQHREVEPAWVAYAQRGQQADAAPPPRAGGVSPPRGAQEGEVLPQPWQGCLSTAGARQVFAI